MRENSASRVVRNFGRVDDAVDTPDLVAVQREGYEHFLQRDVAPTKRKCIGLESIFQETFPIESYDKKMVLEYLYYELEIELLDQGSESDLHTLTGDLRKTWGLRPEPRSKFERGLALIDGGN